MHRISLVVLLACFVLIGPAVGVLAQEGGTPAATSETGNDGDWAGFRGNPARTGATSASGPVDQPGIRWRVETGGGWRHSPAVANGVIYTATEANLLLALDAATGAELWRFAHLPTFSQPAVGDGVVVVGSDDGLYAVDAATGQQRWRYQPDGTPRFVDSSPAIADGVVYIGDGPEGGLFAVDAATGAERWRFDTKGGTFASPAVAGGVVYVATDTVYGGANVGVPSSVYAVDAATGAERWRFDTGDPADTFFASPAVADGAVYIGTQNAADGPTFMLAIDAATGQERWRTPTGRMFSSAAVADGRVYFGADALYAVDAATGQQLWRLGIGEVDSSPAVANSVVYALTYERFLIAADAATGAELWHVATGGGFSSPAVVDGMVYLSGDDGFLYAIGEGGDAPGQTSVVDEAAFASAAGDILTETTLAVDQLPPNPAFAGAFVNSWPVGVGYRYQEDGPGVGINCVLAGRWAYALVDGGTPTAETVVEAGECVTLPAAQHRDERNPGPDPLSLLSFVVLPDGTPGPANLPQEITGGPPIAFFPPPQWGALPAGPLTVTLRRASLAPDAAVGAYDGEGLGGIGAPNSRTTHLSRRADGSVRNLGTEPVDIVLLAVVPEGAASSTTPVPATEPTATAEASPPAMSATSGVLWQVTGGTEPLAGPGDVEVGPDGRIWVVDSQQSRFQIFDADGAFVENWGTAGSGDGEFNFIRANGDALGDIAFDAEGNLYVADTGNRRVQKFDRDRNFVVSWGGFGPGDGQFVDPFSIAVDAGGNVYVVDDRRDDVQKFTADGTYLATIGEHGSGDGQLSFTGGVAVEGDGSILIADFGNNRLVRFAPDGAFLAAIGGVGPGDGQFIHPADVAVDDNGNVYVADMDNQRVQVLSPDGTVLAVWGEPGDAPGQFNLPVGVAVDADGNVYVAELFGNRVQKFAPPALAVHATPVA